MLSVVEYATINDSVVLGNNACLQGLTDSDFFLRMQTGVSVLRLFRSQLLSQSQRQQPFGATVSVAYT